MNDASLTQSEEVRDHAYDPKRHPALFDGVLSRRVLAFLFDSVMILAIMAAMSVLIFILGVLTFSLAWGLYAILFPMVALPYIMVSLGGHRAATPGMRLMGLEMRLWYGARPYSLLAMMHSLIFWFSLAIPLVFLVGLFTKRGQLLHDLVLGTVVLDRDALRDLEKDYSLHKDQASHLYG